MSPSIKGRTVDLRMVNESDIEQLREWRNSKEVSDFMVSRTIISKEQQEAWYRKISNDDSAIYWVILSKKGEKIGFASLYITDSVNHISEPSLYIAKKEYRNSFYGTEAYYHLLDQGFQFLGLDKIHGTVLSTNPPAIRMNELFGFKTEVVQKNAIEINGIEHDVYKVVLDKPAFYESRMGKFYKMK